MSRYSEPSMFTRSIEVESLQNKVDSHAYVPVARTQPDHTDAQKEMIRQYNSMRAKLLEANLMDGKS